MILAIDPSITATGWACVDNPNKVHAAGLFRPAGDDIGARINDLCSNVKWACDQYKPTHAVLEIPQSAGGANRGGYRGHSVMTAPIYGMAVGAALAILQLHEVSLRLCQPSEWVGRGRIPSSRGDPKKLKRIRYVNQVYGCGLEENSTHGNIADAVLMAMWALGRMKH